MKKKKVRLRETVRVSKGILEYVTRIDPVGILHPSDASEFESKDTWF